MKQAFYFLFLGQLLLAQVWAGEEVSLPVYLQVCRTDVVDARQHTIVPVVLQTYHQGHLDPNLDPEARRKCLLESRRKCEEIIRTTDLKMYDSPQCLDLSSLENSAVRTKAVPQATHKKVNKMIEAAAMVLTAPISLPIEIVDVLDDVFYHSCAVGGFCGAKLAELSTEVGYNFAANGAKGLAWFFVSVGQFIRYVVSPQHPSVDPGIDFNWESFNFAGEFRSYWESAALRSGNWVNTWMTEHAYALVGGTPPEAKNQHWGFLRVLTCKMNGERVEDVSVLVVNVVTGFHCTDGENNQYKLYGGGATAVLGAFGRTQSYFTILDFNPFGDIEGAYLIGGPHVGWFGISGTAQVGVSELGLKIVLMASGGDRGEAPLPSLGAETRVLYIKKI